MRSDGNCLFPTLSWQLAISIPEVNGFIVRALYENPSLPTKAVEVQFEQLIAQPLKSIAEDVSRSRMAAPVIIVDGVDECSDAKLQRRLLSVIGNAVTSHRFPLRFLVCSRPEAHIQDTFRQFQRLTLRIDLAKADEAYRDIETYLRSEFSRIASEQQIDCVSWPGEDVIRDFVYKASGQFVYPSTIIKFVADEYNSATSQLDIILGLEPANGLSPFADLDILYIEILRRQPDQKFLKDFLAVLVGRTRLSDEYSRLFTPPLTLSKDDALLLNLDEKTMHRKLRGMHSLLAIGPRVEVHHRSFLDFLQQPARSHQYHVNEQYGMRRYTELIVGALVRYATKVLKQREYHESEHFVPEFGKAVGLYPRSITLPLQQWEESFLPLLNLQDEWLGQLAELCSPWKRGACSECTIFHVINSLLSHLMFLRGVMNSTPFPYQCKPEQLDRDVYISSKEELSFSGYYQVSDNDPDRNRASNNENHLPQPDSNSSMPRGETSVSSAAGTASYETGESPLPKDLETCLSILFSTIGNMKAGLQVNTEIVQLIHRVLEFDHTVVSPRICTISDAQNLVDLIFYMIRNQLFIARPGPDVARNAVRLALEVHARVPVLPGALFLNKTNIQIDGNISRFRACNGNILGAKRMEIMVWAQFHHAIDSICQRALTSAALSHENILPLLGIFEDEERFAVAFLRMPNDTLRKWRWNKILSAKEIQRIMLGVAEAVQYMHSLDLVFDDLSPKFIFLDSKFRPRVAGDGYPIRYLIESHAKDDDPLVSHLWPRESNIFMFGRLYYEVYFDIDLPLHDRFLLDRTEIIKRPSEPEISDKEWRLIQQCCAEDAGERPAIENVISEMESWR